MNFRSTQPRRARIALIGLAAAAASLVALPEVAGASSYPPSPPPAQPPVQPPAQPPVQPPTQPVPPGEVASGGVAAAAGVVTSADALPATGGSDPTQILWIASSALLAGVVISGASMRRRNVADTSS